MMIVAGDPPDFRTISEFRRRHLQALAGLFVQVLQLAEKAGLVKLGHVALDGTKIKANASKHKAMSYERMKKREAELQAEVDRWLEAAEAADAEEDKLYGDRRGDEMPDWVADKQKRLAEDPPGQGRAGGGSQGRRRRGDAAPGTRRKRSAMRRGARRTARRRRRRRPSPTARRSATSPIPKAASSRPRTAYIQGYNAQAAVDARGPDHRGAWPDARARATRTNSCRSSMASKTNLGRKPKEASADAGYCSEANLAALAERDDQRLHRHRTSQTPRRRQTKRQPDR